MPKMNSPAGSSPETWTRLPLEFVPEENSYGALHWAVLSWAKLALDLGARPSVVERITGIDHKDLIRVFFGSQEPRKSAGGLPSSAEWFIKANLIVAVQAADFYAHFDKLRNLGNRPAEALIKGYEKYSQIHRLDLRLSFDRSFDLVTHMDGLWTTSKPELQAIVCPDCRSLFITALGDAKTGSWHCPFCKLSNRYRRSVRLSKPLAAPFLADLGSQSRTAHSLGLDQLPTDEIAGASE